MGEKISSDPTVVGLWTLPIKDVITLLRRGGTPLPDWMDQDVVVSARGDDYTITFVGRRVGTYDT
jgi:hypothetical protein